MPVVALTQTDYHPSITQVTVRIPEDAPVMAAEAGAPTFEVLLTMADGRRAVLRMSGFLRY
jgi:hypothetical protein